jgi:TonB family protein
MRTSTLLSLAASSVVLLTSSLSARAECDPRILESRTHFPRTSQLRAQQGVVLLEVKVDESGRVSETQLLRSSGYQMLDRAASRSVLRSWVFDVSNCERKDLPATDWISVEYRYGE